jgi:succinate dehydrogenase / fumarate reductase iron-sulfur subunit
MNFTLKIWRQKDSKSEGKIEQYSVKNISSESSFFRNDRCFEF